MSAIMRKISNVTLLKIVNKVKRKMNIYIRNGWLFRPVYKVFWKEKKLNLGDRNNNFGYWGWETVDIRDADYIVNFHNAIIPLPDESCSAVYSCGMIEHISDESSLTLFSEVCRVLKTGSRFRVVYPDLDRMIKLYKEGDHDHFLYHIISCQQWVIDEIKSGKIPKESFYLHNNVARVLASYIDTGEGPIIEKEIFDKKINELDNLEFAKWCVSLLDKNRIDMNSNVGHINAFNFSKIKSMLEKVGFTEVVEYNANEYGDEIFTESCFGANEKIKEWAAEYVEAKK